MEDDPLLKLIHSHAKRGITNIPLGVIYLSNSEFNGVINFTVNQYFPRVVDTALTQLSLDDFYIIPIPVNINTSIPNDITQLNRIKVILEGYPMITYFVFSGPTIYINIIFESFFRYNHDKILFCTNSSQIGADYSDNVVRTLPNDYTIGNFIANIFFNKPGQGYFDIIFLPGQFMNNGQTIGYAGIESNIQIFYEFFEAVGIPGYTMSPNPYNPNGNPVTGLPSTTTVLSDGRILPNLGNPDNISRTECQNQISNTLNSSLNPSYYTNNYYASLLMQFIQNDKTFPLQNNPNLVDPTFIPTYPYPEVINWVAMQAYAKNLRYDSITKKFVWDITAQMPYITYLIEYLINFDYTKDKNILLILAQYQFSAIQVYLYYYFPLISAFLGLTTEEYITIFQSKVRFILTNTNNRDEFTYQLFTDPRTFTLWKPSQYSLEPPEPKTWFDLTNLMTTNIVIPRTEQTMFVLFNQMSQWLNLSISGKYYDFSNTTQPSIIALYNALTFLNHFVKNGQPVSEFILSYFINTNLLQFGNNILFNNKMDNIYDITVSTSYFYTGQSISNRSTTTETDPCSDECTRGEGDVTQYLVISSETQVSKLDPPELRSDVKARQCVCPGYRKFFKNQKTSNCWYITKDYYNQKLYNKSLNCSAAYCTE